MTLSLTISNALDTDDIDAAVDQATQAVKAAPLDFEARLLLAELSVVAGDLERAETHAKMAARNAPQHAMGLSVFRQHLRGMEARREWWLNGAVPVFPSGPSELSNLALAVNVALREADTEGAKRNLDALEQKRGTQPVNIDGVACEDFRDLDDRLPHALEVVTAGGNYMWLDLKELTEIAFTAARRPLDMAYRSARITMANGSAADVLIPAIYPDPAGAAQSLGRVTEFEEVGGGLVKALGQRAWLAGDEMKSISEIEKVTVPRDG